MPLAISNIFAPSAPVPIPTAPRLASAPQGESFELAIDNESAAKDTNVDMRRPGRKAAPGQKDATGASRDRNFGISAGEGRDSSEADRATVAEGAQAQAATAASTPTAPASPTPVGEAGARGDTVGVTEDSPTTDTGNDSSPTERTFYGSQIPAGRSAVAFKTRQSLVRKGVSDDTSPAAEHADRKSATSGTPVDSSESLMDSASLLPAAKNLAATAAALPRTNSEVEIETSTNPTAPVPLPIGVADAPNTRKNSTRIAAQLATLAILSPNAKDSRAESAPASTTMTTGTDAQSANPELKTVQDSLTKRDSTEESTENSVESPPLAAPTPFQATSGMTRLTAHPTDQNRETIIAAAALKKGDAHVELPTAIDHGSNTAKAALDLVTAKVHERIEASKAPTQETFTKILDSLRGELKSTADRITLHLEPAELGKVEVQLLARGDAVTVRFAAERQDVADLLRRDQQALHKVLSDAGVNVSDLNVRAGLDQGARRNPWQDRSDEHPSAPPFDLRKTQTPVATHPKALIRTSSGLDILA